MEQSDTPRVDAAAKRGSDLGGANTMWSAIWPLARDLERALAAATRERDEARAEVERLRKTLDEIATYWNGSHRPAETLDAAEWMRGVAEEALAATEPQP